ncbi:hypothetical protein [Streptococcus suis]|uniref:Uncharacterized protein n=1 Tax=Streptococcus suis TaxID=1307 RepID=A0A7T1LAV2_STRSU|nr:hypothetical protein [Streptococcus suis]MDW8720739.1 hypothetical protein [Streptococcus suis]MDY7596207.1 hypothetical protein [Streptococcus suis]QPO26997.1 hypothetical protein I5V48_02330 [Streptococcus suis]WNF69858.1 hypothetical protein RJW57_02365 [Streptococcus suis]HEL1580465.1 hypothetical protein [Streptococcus suis]
MRGKISVSYHSEPCRVRIHKEWRRAEFLGLFQDTGTDLLGRPYARPVAAVKINGRLVRAVLSEVKFDEEAE